MEKAAFLEIAEDLRLSVNLAAIKKGEAAVSGECDPDSTMQT